MGFKPIAISSARSVTTLDMLVADLSIEDCFVPRNDAWGNSNDGLVNQDDKEEWVSDYLYISQCPIQVHVSPIHINDLPGGMAGTV